MANQRGWAEAATRVWLLPFQLVRTRWAMRRCNHVGRLTRHVARSPLINNNGTITIGDRGVFNSRYAPVALAAASAATVSIGDRAVINFGTSISAHHSVAIGDDVTIGPYCIIDDRPLDPELEPAPITIADGCWLASRVTVLPGSTIGAGAVIAAGTVVDGKVPGGVIYGGSPARVIRQLNQDQAKAEP